MMLTRMRGGEDVACKYLKLGILEGSTKELFFFFFPFCKSINFFITVETAREEL